MSDEVQLIPIEQIFVAQVSSSSYPRSAMPKNASSVSNR